jgi:hypothetical protein
MYYPPFRAETEEELAEQSVVWLRACVEDLMEFPIHVLADAWKEVRRSHKVERWPTIQVIRDACLANSGEKPHQVSTTSPQFMRNAEYHRSGFWMGTWGPRPETPEEAHAHHERWMANFWATATPEIAEIAQVNLARFRAGESASKILEETFASMDAKNPMLQIRRVWPAQGQVGCHGGRG